MAEGAGSSPLSKELQRDERERMIRSVFGRSVGSRTAVVVFASTMLAALALILAGPAADQAGNALVARSWKFTVKP